MLKNFLNRFSLGAKTSGLGATFKFKTLKYFFLSLQAGSSPVSSISGFSVGSGRVDEAVDDFKVGFLFGIYGALLTKEMICFLKPFSLYSERKFKYVSIFRLFWSQDTDPFKSKENLFSSSETGKL